MKAPKSNYSSPKEKKDFIGYDLSGLPFFFWIPYLIVSFFKNLRK